MARPDWKRLAVGSCLLCLFLVPVIANGIVDDDFLLSLVNAKGKKAGQPGFDPALDLYQDGRIDSKDIVIAASAYKTAIPTPFVPTPTVPVPTDTPIAPPTDTPTLAATDTPAGPTETPTQGAATFDIGDFFPLALDSEWTYTDEIQQTPGDSDAFTWSIDADPGTSQREIGGNLVTLVTTTTVEPTDDRNGDQDFWRLTPEGDLLYYGFHNGQADDFSFPPFASGTLPVQDILLNTPLKIGEAGMTPGAQVTDSTSFSAQAIVNGAPQTLSGQGTSTVTYVGFLNEMQTPLGTFSNVLHVRIAITGSVTFGFVTIPFDFKNSEIFLVRHVGMVVQDQDPDPDDALRQHITDGFVGGVPIVASR